MTLMYTRKIQKKDHKTENVETTNTETQKREHRSGVDIYFEVKILNGSSKRKGR